MLVIVAVAVLTSLRPGRDVSTTPASIVREVAAAPAPPRGTVVFAAEAKELAVGLSVRPGAPLGLTATVIGQTGFGVDGLDVRLSARSAAGTRSVAAHPCGHGCYAGSIALAHPSRFGVVVCGDGAPRTLAFPVRQWPPPLGHRLPEPGHPLLRRAPVGRLPRAPRLRPDPCNHDPVDARGARERRVHDCRRRAGNRDRQAAVGSALADGPVDAVGLGPLPQPASPWGTRSRDARIMRQSPSDVTLSWVDPVIPAWYTATFTRAKALPTTLR